MISLTSAKLLLLVALCLGPKSIPPTVLITSNTGTVNIVWEHQNQLWTVKTKAIAAGAWPDKGTDYSNSAVHQLPSDDRHLLEQVRKHGWSENSVLILDNGDRVEKKGDKSFYTVSPGSPYQKTYTMLFVDEGNFPK